MTIVEVEAGGLVEWSEQAGEKGGERAEKHGANSVTQLNVIQYTLF